MKNLSYFSVLIFNTTFLSAQETQTETTIENAKAYCQNWAEVIKNDEKMVIQAAQQAQKAVDYIMECGE